MSEPSLPSKSALSYLIGPVAGAFCRRLRGLAPTYLGTECGSRPQYGESHA